MIKSNKIIKINMNIFIVFIFIIHNFLIISSFNNSIKQIILINLHILNPTSSV